MFKKVITHKGFWVSVLVLGLVYGVLLFLLQWAFIGFPPDFFSEKNLWVVLATFIVIAFVCGFSVTYGKFYRKLKQDELKK